MEDQSPVLIVGAGPVGLSLAWMLIQHNCPVQVFEALPELSPQDRANTFHPPILELFQSWGILDTLIAHGEVVREVQYFERESRRRVAAFDFDLIKDFTPHPFRLHLPQYQLGQILQPLLANSDLASLHFSHRFVRFQDLGTHVEAVFQTPHGEKVVTGSFLCAVDGARSHIRQQADIAFAGKTHPDRFLLVDSDARLESVFSNIGPLNYIFDPDEWVIIQRMKGRTRFTFRVLEEEDAAVATSPNLVYRRIDRFAPNISHNIRHSAVYEVHQRVASTFRQGRVLLLGDAAHLTNPIGGRGLNSGIQDAQELAQRLAKVLAGESDQHLDDYSQLRRQVALENIQPHDEQAYADMVADSHHDIVRRTEKFNEIVTNLTLARNFLLHLSMLEDRIPTQ